MLTYTYKAKNDQGVAISGCMLAGHRSAVVEALRKKGYYLLSVEPENRLAHMLRSSAGFGNHVGVRDKAIFTRQLATLLRAGSQLSAALNALSRQTKNKHFASVIEQVHTDIEGSSSLSQAMAKHPKVFSSVYCAIVAAAEEAGTLSETLSVLSDQLKSQASVNARIKGALVYPIFLLVVSAVVVGVLTAFVIPKFLELFVNSGQRLPMPTQMLVATTALVRNGWWGIVIGLATVVSILLMALKQDHIRLWYDRSLLRLPLIGPLSQKMLLARFARTMGSLLDGGVRIVSAVKTTRGTATNRAFARDVSGISEALLKGSSLAAAVAQQQHFSEIAANMIAVGEQSGTLPEMLLEVADMYDQECESALHSVTSLLGPAMIVVLGFIIGFVVVAILLPIFETSTMVR